MPCYSPLRAWIGEGPQGRRLLFKPLKLSDRSISLPCGRCIGCRLERGRQWSVRIMHEAKMHDACSFLTLTFDEAHYPKGCALCCPGVPGSLCVCTCQLFLKKLRERVNYGRFKCFKPVRLRFFLCGEYGEKLGRPHYHAIIFGWSFPDRVPSKSSGKFTLYTSALLSETWGNGNAWIGDVSFDSAMYVANYSTKKITGPKAKEFYGGRKPEFLLMSRRPGIGKSWIEKFSSDVYPADEVIVRGQSARPPRYYDLVLASKNPDLLEKLKLKRAAEADVLEKFSIPSGQILEVAPTRNGRRLAVREQVARAKLALKRRSLESD